MFFLALYKKGSVLISALFVVSLVAIVAMAMSLRLQQNLYTTRLTLANATFYLASQLVNFCAVSALSQKKLPFCDLNQLLIV